MGKIKIKTKYDYGFEWFEFKCSDSLINTSKEIDSSSLIWLDENGSVFRRSHLNTDILKETYSLKNLPERLRWQGGKRFIEKYRGYAIYLKDNEYIALPKPKLGSICGKTVEEVKECIDYIEQEKAIEDWMKEK